jgi:hypothetical protein
VLAIVLFLPIPLGTIVPGFAISLLAIGILERDGIAVLLGMAAGAIGLLLVGGVLYGLTEATLFIIQNALGL